MATELFKLMGRIYIEADDAEAELKSFEALITNAVAALQSIDAKLTTVNSTLNTMDTRLSNANGELSELHNEATSANGALNNLDGNVESLNGSMNTLDSRMNAVVNELGQLNANARQAGNRLIGMNGTLGQLHNPFSSDGALGAGAVWLGNILEDLTYKALDLSWEFMKIGINFNASAESYQASFKTMLGVTEEEAAAIYEKLRQFAVDTPYSMEGVADSAVRLFNAGYNVDGTLEMLEVFGNIANGDSAKMQRLVKAWTDTKGYGRLRAQERNQFIENGVMIDQLLADYYQSKGIQITADEIMAKLEAKEVAEIDVLNALIMAQLEGGNFYNAMANYMDTYGGMMEKTEDQLEETAGAFTLPIFETLKNETLPEISRLLTEFKEWATQNQSDIEAIASTLSSMAIVSLDGLLSVFQFCVDNKDILVPALSAIATEIAAMAAVAHPFAAITFLLGALVAFMDTDWQNFESNYPQLVAMFEGLTGLDFTEVSNSLSGFQENLDGIIGWFLDNETVLNALLTVIGAIAFSTGHWVLGTALVGAGVGSLWEESKALVEAAEESQKRKDNFDPNTNYLNYASSMYASPGEYKLNGVPLTEAMLDEWITILSKGMVDNPDYMETARKVGAAWYGTQYVPEITLDGDESALPAEFQYQQLRRQRDYVPGTSEDGTSGSNNLITQLIAVSQQLSTLKADVAAGAQEGVANGLSGATITGTITTGDVKLQDGTLVGRLAPQLDLRLGWQDKFASRGNA